MPREHKTKLKTPYFLPKDPLDCLQLLGQFMEADVVLAVLHIDFNENSSIIGVIFPSKFTYALGSIATALSMQYYAINFSDSGIAIIGLNNATGKLEDEAFLFVPKEEIASTKFNKKLMSYELEVATSKGTLAFKVNKTMVGAPWHKENLATILKSL